ncbi:MAG TPA: inositol monophosphatase family protein, partial [Vitreimonas sp.]|nr:inositol monophosphatase family protein [Vitreimonas sp.]
AAWRERGFGDFWGYALVAEGAAEAMIEAGLRPWDAAAPAILVEEAGGQWSDIDGQPRIDTGTFVATNGILHDEVRRRLRTSQEGSGGG